MKFPRLIKSAAAANTYIRLPRFAWRFISALLLIISINFCKSIVVPGVWDLLETFEETNEHGDRRFINVDIPEDFEKERKLRRTIPCLVTFVETYLNIQPSRIPVLLAENSTDEIFDITKLYLTALQKIRSIYVLSGHLDPSSDHMTTLTGLVILEDSVELSSMSSQLIDLCGRDCKYLVILTRTFPNEEAFLEETTNLGQLFWIRRIANVVFLSAVGHSVLVSRSLSFKPNISSEPVSPVLVAECDENSNWSDAKWGAVSAMYSPLKMNKCTINVAFFDYEPFVMAIGFDEDNTLFEPHTSFFKPNTSIDDQGHDRDHNNHENTTEMIKHTKLAGIEGLILNTLATSLNFIISGEKIPWSNGTSLEAEVDDALWGKGQEEVDLVLGGLPWAPEGETDYTLPYDVVRFVWLIPIRPNVSLQGLIAPLHKNVWFAVIGLVIFAFTIEFTVHGKVSFLEILSLVIGVAWPHQPKTLSARIVFISWVIFGYVLTQCYLASLAGQLMASSGMQIETLRELATSSFDIGGDDSVKSLFQMDSPECEDDLNDDDTIELNRVIDQKLQIFDHNEYAERFRDLIDEKNHSLALAVRMNMSSMTPSFEGKHVHKMKENLASYPLAFAVWRGMPYLSVFDKQISNLIEGGIVGFWGRRISLLRFGYYKTDERINEGNLSLQALIPSFLLLFMGHVYASLLLFLEIAIFSWKSRNKNTLKREVTYVKLKRMAKKNKLDRTSGKMLLEPLDASVWIMGFDRRYQYQRSHDNQLVYRSRFPLEFVH